MFNKIYDKIKRFIKENYLSLLFIIFLLIINFVKVPYIIYKPGGSINLNDRIDVDNNYNISGKYSMNYVTVVKGNLLTTCLSFIIPDWDLKKEKDVTGNMDYDTLFQIERIDLKNSLFLATYNAYKKAGKEIKITGQKNYVSIVSDESDTNLKVMDEIVSIDDNAFNNLSEFQKYISSLSIDDKVKFIVKENGKEVTKYGIVKDFDGQKKIGIGITSEYEYETDPKISISTRASEAGSSGGLMLTLTIYEKVAENDLSHGKNVMGTGTIDEDGNIGAIGGVKYKMLGAAKDGAEIFFIPKENYEEALSVYKKHDLKFKLVMVETLDDAINYLKTFE